MCFFIISNVPFIKKKALDLSYLNKGTNYCEKIEMYETMNISIQL